MSRIKTAIRKSGLIGEGETVVVGFSGGADSMALLHALHTLGIAVIACHVNHNLRGEESRRDEEAARAFCETLGVPVAVLQADVRKAAAERGCGEEEAGREIRYAFFEEIREKYGADKIATAHTMSDQAETVLYRLVRGSGMKGLRGIPSQRGCIIRPLLTVSRGEIEAYCRENGLAFVQDSSNTDVSYDRNRIRRETLPSLEAIRPNAAETIARTASVLAQEDDWLEEQAESMVACVVCADGYDAAKLRELHPAMQRRIACRILKKECGEADFASCEALLHLLTLSSGRITVHGDTVLCIRRDRLFAERETPLPPFCEPLLIGKNTEAGGICLKAEIIEANVYALSEKVYKKLLYPAFDYDTIKGRIFVRQKKDGDRIAFSHRSGTKSLKKWFSEAGLTAREKSEVLVFEDTGRVIGVLGFGVSRENAVTPETKRILLITPAKGTVFTNRDFQTKRER